MTTTASKHAALIRERAGPLKIPCVKIAYILVAPACRSFSAARQIVPHLDQLKYINGKGDTKPRILWTRPNFTYVVTAIENQNLRIRHVVNKNCNFFLDFTYKYHPCYLVCFLPFFVN